MARRKRSNKRKHPATLGALGATFHGAFKSEDAAARKARARGGYYVRKRIMFRTGSQVRYVVLTRDGSGVPF